MSSGGPVRQSYARVDFIPPGTMNLDTYGVFLVFMLNIFKQDNGKMYNMYITGTLAVCWLSFVFHAYFKYDC
jgi:hypothetical protein